jgi:hypothetical protein
LDSKKLQAIGKERKMSLIGSMARAFEKVTEDYLGT